MDKSEVKKRLDKLTERISPEGINDSEKKEILAELDDILSSDSQNTDVYFYKGLVYEMNLDYENAIATYEEILKINPDNKDAKDRISDCTCYMKWDQYKAKELDENNKKKHLTC